MPSPNSRAKRSSGHRYLSSSPPPDNLPRHSSHITTSPAYHTSYTTHIREAASAMYSIRFPLAAWWLQKAASPPVQHYSAAARWATSLLSPSASLAYMNSALLGTLNLSANGFGSFPTLALQKSNTRGRTQSSYLTIYPLFRVATYTWTQGHVEDRSRNKTFEPEMLESGESDYKEGKRSKLLKCVTFTHTVRRRFGERVTMYIG